jgi:hypothetical protein
MGWLLTALTVWGSRAALRVTHVMNQSLPTSFTLHFDVLNVGNLQHLETYHILHRPKGEV